MVLIVWNRSRGPGNQEQDGEAARGLGFFKKPDSEPADPSISWRKKASERAVVGSLILMTSIWTHLGFPVCRGPKLPGCERSFQKKPSEITIGISRRRR